MTNADRLIQWNRWFDSTPEHWRAHIVMWPLVFAGFLNMQLTIAGGFPFGLLVLLAIIAMALVRVPYKSGWLKPAANGAATGAKIEVGRIDWLYDINTRFDSLSDLTKLWLPAAILAVAGVLNIWLLARAGWAFGSLFLIALLLMVVIRAPYSWRIITPPPAEEQRNASFAGWLADANAWYDGQVPERRFWSGMIGLAVVFVIDIKLVAAAGLSLGLVFLLDLLAVVAVRAPYVAGALTLPPRRVPPIAIAQPPRQIEQQHAPLAVDAVSHHTPDHVPAVG